MQKCIIIYIYTVIAIQILLHLSVHSLNYTSHVHLTVYILTVTVH